MNNLPQRSFSAEQIAARNKIGRTTVFKEIRLGRLRARKVGSRTLITIEDEQNWLNKLPLAESAVA